MKSETKQILTSLFLFIAILGPIKTGVNYLFEPVNCVTKTGLAMGTTIAKVLPELGTELKDGFVCVWGNVTGHSIA